MLRRNETKEVVFLPSFGASLASYPRLLRGLQESGMRVHGVPYDWDDTEATLEDFVTLAREHVDALGVSERAVLLGHSIGGILAGYEAQHRSYDRLVLCSTSLLGPLAIDWGQSPFPEVRASWENARRYKLFNGCRSLLLGRSLVMCKLPRKNVGFYFGNAK